MTTPVVFSPESDRAFPSLARIERYFPAASCETARRRLEVCVARGEGPAMVIGAPGVGKTMLLDVLAAGLRDNFTVVQLLGTQACTRRALLQAILQKLGRPCRERDEGALRAELTAELNDTDARPRGVVVLVDEAQSLSARLLEELRGLSNLARRGEPLVRLVLAGGPQLEETFASPELEVFNQRLAARCYLSPMTFEETREYVRAHVAAVDGDPDEVFTPDALEAVFSASDGAPRLVNQVCDRALVMAVADSLGAVDGQMIQRAWSDLHQLPAPWHTPSPAPAHYAASVVEFGELDDAAAQREERLEEPTELDEDDPPAPLWNADNALGEIRRAAPSRVARSEGDDPFGDDFPEEEVVIDRFASLASAFHAATPAVRNREDPTLSSLVHEVAPPECEEPGEDEAAEPEHSEVLRLAPSDDEPAKQTPHLGESSRVDDDAPWLAIADDEDDSELLIIEYDSADRSTGRPRGVAPRGYRQLFTQLRRG